jgi:hypothetical protein
MVVDVGGADRGAETDHRADEREARRRLAHEGFDIEL